MRATAGASMRANLTTHGCGDAFKLATASPTFAWLERRRAPGGTTTITTRGEPA